jgi:sugar phosphate isomerase/epimerase
MLIEISCPELSFRPLSDALELVKGGFDGIEILAEEEHRAENIERTEIGMKASIHAPFNDLNIASLREEHRLYSIKEIEKVVIVAEKKGIGLVTFHPGWPSPFSMGARERVLERARESIVELNEFAYAHHVTLCTENMPIEGFFSSAEALLEVTDSVCFDAGHANITGSIDSFLDHRECIKNVHLHENSGKQDEHLPLTGEHIDIERIVRALGDKNYVIEARSVEEGEKSRDFLKRRQT